MNKNKFLIFTFSLILLISSCKNTKTHFGENEVREWQGKEIIIPSDSLFQKIGKDTISANKNFKILMYVDTVGCLSCKLQLRKWEKFMTVVDSVSNKNVTYLFYVNPKKVEDLRFVLYRDNFTYPVFLDMKDSLNTLNNFSSEFIFQTFLLDKNNKVLLIGNPMISDDLMKLYINKIQSKI